MKNYQAKKLALLISQTHGSGIDGTWSISESKRNIVLINSIHCMDKYGGYDGWMDFRILINKKNPFSGIYYPKVKFSTNNYYRRKYADGWKEYLEQLISHRMETSNNIFYYKRSNWIVWNID